MPALPQLKACRADRICDSPGSHSTIMALTAAMQAITNSNCVNPEALTKGPSMYTASELIPKEIAILIPLTLERIESSMYRTTIASLKGIAPNTLTM